MTLEQKEADEKALVREGTHSKIYNLGCSAPEKVGTAELKIPFMTDGTIDVEGTELDVLKGFSLERYGQKLILPEDKLVYLNKTSR